MYGKQWLHTFLDDVMSDVKNFLDLEWVVGGSNYVLGVRGTKLVG